MSPSIPMVAPSSGSPSIVSTCSIQRWRVLITSGSIWGVSVTRYIPDSEMAVYDAASSAGVASVVAVAARVAVGGAGLLVGSAAVVGDGVTARVAVSSAIAPDGWVG